MYVDYDWVKQQFAEAKIRVGVGKATIKLLETWENLDLSPAQAKEVASVFSRLALTHTIVETPKNEIWAPVMRGNIVVGDVVRVKQDAFDGKKGVLYNGRSGSITAIRSGDIIFNSKDAKDPAITGAHFAPEDLEKRVK